MDKFNLIFKKSTKNTTCELYTEMYRPIRYYTVNVLMPVTVISAGISRYQLSFQFQGQLDEENLSVGSGTWGVLAELEEEQDVKLFF